MSGSQLALLGGPVGAGAAGDPNWQNVTLLSGTTSTNAGQNNTFLDSSSNAFSITRNGNTTQGTFSPFSQANGYWSNYFDGSGDYLTVSSSADFNLSSGNWTVEGWLYSVALASDNRIFSLEGTSNSFALIRPSGNTTALEWNQVGSAPLITSGTGAAPANQWVHFALVSNSGTITLYVNGVSAGTTTTYPNNSNTQFTIAATAVRFATSNTNAYLSNIRVVKGTAVYTTGFTPPTAPLTAITNTVLLTCQGNRFYDANTQVAAKTINVFGNTAVVPFQPFGAPIVPYSASTIGGSGYFDGTGDYLDIASNSVLTPSGNFTIEFWAYVTDSSGTQEWYSKGYGIQLYITSPSWGVAFSANNDGNYFVNLTSSSNVQINAWTHFAVTRSGNSYRFFINGVQQGSTVTSSSAPNTGTSVLRIGNWSDTPAYGSKGYMAGVRYLNGTAQYTADFTPPTSPPTAITNTTLLCNFTNANIYDQAADNDFETVGNAQVSTSVKKFGDSSMSFDGNGDRLFAKQSSIYDFGTGEFTIECWVYFNTVSNSQQCIVSGYSSPNGWNFQFRTDQGISPGCLHFAAGDTTILNSSGLTLSTATWYHIAVVRCGGTIKLYLNGIAVGSVAYTSAVNTVNNLLVGALTDSVSQLDGYISDLRITKGLGRYPYNFTPPIVALPNFFQAATTPAADPYFNYTTLLLPGSGTNGAQNNTFLDSSSNTFSITRNGNTTQGTFSPFSQTGWSNYFDGGGGTGDYLSVPDNDSLEGFADFTIEGWVYVTDFSSGDVIAAKGWTPGGYTPWMLYFSSTDLTFYASSTFSSWNIANGAVIIPNIQKNTWYHFAVSRSGSSLRLFSNGVLTTTVSTSTTLGTNAGALTIGASLNGDRDPAMYLSNFRINTTALYTAAFTPSTTPLTAVANTSLLTCQSNRFVDNSTNAFAITRNGDVSVQAFSPFAPTAAYSAATNGGSGYFDGTGDYLSTSTSQIIPTGSFTIEAWVYTTQAIATAKNIISQGTSGDSGRVAMSIEGSLWWFQIGSNVVNAGTPVLGQWNYVAMTYNGSTIQGYVNGVSQGTVSNTNNPQNTTLSIGSEWLNQYWNGYIASVRISNTVRTVTTVPTTPFTTDANTRFLCNFTNAGITDATAKNDLETVGNAQISNGQAKWGSTSIAFDGTGDYLVSNAGTTDLYAFSSGDFTIEMWIRFNATSTVQVIYDSRPASTQGTYPLIYASTDGTINYYVSSANQITSSAVSSGQWYHLAVSRYGTSTKMFINGNQTGSTYTDSTTYLNGSGRPWVGFNAFNSNPDQALNAYIQDLRVTKGIARYTQNFTPPTAAFQLL